MDYAIRKVKVWNLRGGGFPLFLVWGGVGGIVGIPNTMKGKKKALLHLDFFTACISVECLEMATAYHFEEKKCLLKIIWKLNLIKPNPKNGFEVHNYRHIGNFQPNFVALHTVASSKQSKQTHKLLSLRYIWKSRTVMYNN